jgi:hypothetical protein
MLGGPLWDLVDRHFAVLIGIETLEQHLGIGALGRLLLFACQRHARQRGNRQSGRKTS